MDGDARERPRVEFRLHLTEVLPHRTIEDHAHRAIGLGVCMYKDDGLAEVLVTLQGVRHQDASRNRLELAGHQPTNFVTATPACANSSATSGSFL